MGKRCRGGGEEGEEEVEGLQEEEQEQEQEADAPSKATCLPLRTAGQMAARQARPNLAPNQVLAALQLARCWKPACRAIATQPVGLPAPVTHLEPGPTWRHPPFTQLHPRWDPPSGLFPKPPPSGSLSPGMGCPWVLPQGGPLQHASTP